MDKGRMEGLREEAGVKERFRRKLVRSQLKWAGHVGRMEGERLTKEADEFEWRVKEEEEDRG